MCVIVTDMQPFIPAKDLAYFEQLVESIGLTGVQPGSPPAGQSSQLVTTVKWIDVIFGH